MPLVRSIDKLADGLRITRSAGAVLTVTSADIPANIKNQGASAVQTWVNNWLTQQGWNSSVRVNSITPLDVDVVIGDKPFTFVWTSFPSVAG